MAEHNRHLRGDREEVLVDVKGSTVVEAGDLMFADRTAGVRGVGEDADYYAYPISYAANTGTPGTGIQYGIYTNFLGVAMESSPSGVTEKISVARAGAYRYPLYRNGAVTVGALVSAVSTFTSGTGVSDQVVFMSNSAPGSTAYLGYIVKTESGASFVDFEIRTAFGPGGLAS